jgi:hypothetical protein
MATALIVLQVVIALGIFNVWILRFGKATEWRGGDASTMQQEFAVYGLPSWSVQVVGALKLLCAAGLIVGIWVPGLTLPAAAGLAALMIGAIAMHIKVKDPLKKSLPALTMLVMCLLVAGSHVA